eukprot:TRINITY_DN6216_c0_g1_i1.p1 TRINITY_DN6216_c0_g1~~TRINITY_DN6216_c0_g1_i1.p1  ORF type:complete len:585 (+),score=123.78 TRINITY_DN6216_c0_g1_i1:30-1784(+)
MDSELKQQVDNWLLWDPNPQTKQHIQQLLQNQLYDQLRDRLIKRISFGTAGLRGKVTAGFAYMNDLTVTQAGQGFCAYLLTEMPDIKEKGIALGYDARFDSKRFSEITAAVFVSRGVPVYMFEGFVPTPLVSFAITNLNCGAGIVVTASHNPKDDNGYKVYWSNSSQLTSPHDKGISQSIYDNLVPWEIDIEGVYDHPLYHTMPQSVTDEYFAATKEFCYFEETNTDTDLKITYTAMHGVGTPYVEIALNNFNLNPFVPVVEQNDPDPNFPTVTFPNPEEGKGALKLAMETAERAESPIIIANDPDADRLAAAEKHGSEWYILNGNEIGALLAHWVFTNYKENHPESDNSKLLFINSTVSSKMISAIAEKEGLRYEETLTGFKWIGNKSYDLTQEGYKTLFAYEEAIGYMIGDICLDKDGVRGASVFCEMATELYRRGTTLVDHLNSLYETYGHYRTKNKYYFSYESHMQPEVFAAIREGGYPESCGRFAITRIRDLTSPGYDSGTHNNIPIFPVSGSQMITFYFENGGIVTLRGSGTEPKLKYYCELHGENSEEVESELNELCDSVIQDLLQPEKFGLVAPSD